MRDWKELWSTGDQEGDWYIVKSGDSRTPYIAGNCDGEECFASWAEAREYVQREGRWNAPEVEPRP